MRRADPRLRRLPGGFRIAVAGVAQRGRGHQQPLRRRRQRGGERHRRIEPVAVQADIDARVRPRRRSRRRNRIVLRTAARLRRRFGERAQHRLPGRRAASSARRLQRAAGGLDAVARGAVHILRLLVEPRRAGVRAGWRAARRCGPARGRAARRPPATSGPSGKTSHSSAPNAAGLVLAAARASTCWRIRRRNASVGFGRAGLQAGQVRSRPRRAARPARRRQRARRLQCGVQRRLQHRAGRDQFLDAPLQAAGARPSALGAEQPAAQLGGLQPGQLGGEGAVGGVEQVVALVEHVAGRHGAVVQPAPGGLRHHQRVVGHHQLGGAGAADRVLDEAAPPVRAGGVDALAAPVGEAQRCMRGAEQFGEPAGQVAALDVAVVGRQRPAGDQAERDQRAGANPP